MIDLLITGVYGQLGQAVAQDAASRGLDARGHDLDTLDISDPEAIARMVGELRPRAVVNCAAYTAVDDCEANPELARKVNGEAVGHMARACNDCGATLVHVSTDYVFPGQADHPLCEDDPVGPVSAYGRSKLEGENRARDAHRHLILRTAWLYGHGGHNFVEAIRGQVDKGRKTLKVVADQRGCPTLADDLASATLDLLEHEASGVFHVVNSGATTWHGFATEIVRLLGAAVEVLPVTTEEFPRPAPRPSYSVLDTSRLTSVLGSPMPTWQDALARYMERPCES